MGQFGRLLIGQVAPVDEIVERVAAGRQIVLRTALVGVGRLRGSDPPPDLMRLEAGQVVVELACDVSLEDPDDLFLRLALFGSPLDVRAGGWMRAHAGRDDVP